MLSRLNKFFMCTKLRPPVTSEMISNSYNIDNIEIKHLRMILLNIKLRQIFRFIGVPFIGIKHPGVFSHSNDFGFYNFIKFSAILKPLFNVESKLQELFEMSDMSKYLAASIVNFDFCEMSYLDNYKEAYPFTSFYAKCQYLIKYKDYYTYNTADFELEEIEKCFNNLEKFVKNYENIILLSSFAEEMKNVLQRLYVNPQKKSSKLFLSVNTYDTKERVHNDLKTLCDNYRIIYESLSNYPEWQRKLETDIGKLFAYSNIQDKSPEVFDILNKHKLFK